MGEEKIEKMLNVREFAEATDRVAKTITNKAREIPGHKKIQGRWYFPESSILWMKKRKVGAPFGNRSGYKYGGKAKKGVKKILWVSSCDVHEVQKAVIRKIFGKNIVLMEYIKSAYSAEVVLREFERGSFDEIIIDAPYSVVCRIIELGVKPFWPVTKIVKNSKDADWKKGASYIKFINFRRVEGFKIKFKK